jgi:transposase
MSPRRNVVAVARVLGALALSLPKAPDLSPKHARPRTGANFHIILCGPSCQVVGLPQPDRGPASYPDYSRNHRSHPFTACCGEVGRNSASSDLMKAYSVDLREKIVAAVRRGMSKAQAARAFRVGATSVKRYVKLAEEGKPLTPGKAPGKQSKLGEGGMRLLEEDLRARPGGQSWAEGRVPLRAAWGAGERADYL